MCSAGYCQRKFERSKCWRKQEENKRRDCDHLRTRSAIIDELNKTKLKIVPGVHGSLFRELIIVASGGSQVPSARAL